MDRLRIRTDGTEEQSDQRDKYEPVECRIVWHVGRVIVNIVLDDFVVLFVDRGQIVLGQFGQAETDFQNFVDHKEGRHSQHHLHKVQDARTERHFIALISNRWHCEFRERIVVWFWSLLDKCHSFGLSFLGAVNNRDIYNLMHRYLRCLLFFLFGFLAASHQIGALKRNVCSFSILGDTPSFSFYLR